MKKNDVVKREQVAISEANEVFPSLDYLKKTVECCSLPTTLYYNIISCLLIQSCISLDHLMAEPESFTTTLVTPGDLDTTQGRKAKAQIGPAVAQIDPALRLSMLMSM
jgi:hypothetical protein